MWRAASYVAFGGLFTCLFSRDADVARHGRRGFIIFIWEVIALVLLDIIRLRVGWPAAPVFAAAVVVIGIIKLTIIIRVLWPRRVAAPLTTF